MGNPITSDQLGRYWREHIDACHDSGESGAAYCARHQLAYHRFNYWRRKFRDQDSRVQSQFRCGSFYKLRLGNRVSDKVHVATRSRFHGGECLVIDR